MAKSKKGVSHAGPHKKHGPKRKLFHNYGNKVTRLDFGNSGLLNKYYCLESFILSCQARGLRHGSSVEWENRFKIFTQDLKTKEEQKEWLKKCKYYKDPDLKENKNIKKA